MMRPPDDEERRPTAKQGGASKTQINSNNKQDSAEDRTRQRAERPRLRITEWRPLIKNTLRGFCIIELPSGLIVREVSVHTKNGKAWASLPSRPQLDGDGRQVVNHAGKKQYTALLGWRDRDLSDRFSIAVIDAVLAAHPDALGGDDL